MSELAEFARIFEVLALAEVRCILVGGFAAIVHGAARTTYDVDVVYARDLENIARLCTALQPWRPYLRGAVPGLPFTLDERTVRMGLNFTLQLRELGDLDLLGEVTGGGSYEQLNPHATDQVVFGYPIRCVTLEKLIEIKRAAGRPKDFEAVAELETIRLERGQRKRRATE